MTDISKLVVAKRAQNTLPISLGENLLKDYSVNMDFLKNQFYVDAKYAQSLGLLFRFDSKKLGCINCTNFGGEWTDGDEVKETCYILKEVHIGHKGVISNRQPCNFYDVISAFYLKDPQVHPNLVDAFKEETKELELRPTSAYQLLLTELENAKWITKNSK